FVASPSRIGSTPVAAGSRVPAWPTRRRPSRRRTRVTASNEVTPGALSTTSTPASTRILLTAGRPAESRRAPPAPPRARPASPRPPAPAPCSRPRCDGRRRRTAPRSAGRPRHPCRGGSPSPRRRARVGVAEGARVRVDGGEEVRGDRRRQRDAQGVEKLVDHLARGRRLDVEPVHVGEAAVVRVVVNVHDEPGGPAGLVDEPLGTL